MLGKLSSALLGFVLAKNNLEPRIIVNEDGKTALLSLFLGFEQDDWVFFEEIKINTDGDIVDWEIPYGDRKTQVLYGGIAEWTSKVSILDNTLINIMSKIANAENAKIRFSGQGYRDHVVTKQEKNNLKLFLELYDCYENNDSLLNDINTNS